MEKTKNLNLNMIHLECLGEAIQLEVSGYQLDVSNWWLESRCWLEMYTWALSANRYLKINCKQILRKEKQKLGN